MRRALGCSLVALVACGGDRATVARFGPAASRTDAAGAACAGAPETRARVATLVREGRIARAARTVRDLERLCPEEAAESGAARMRIEAELGAPGRGDELLAQAAAATARGDSAGAQRLLDRAGFALERETGRKLAFDLRRPTRALGADSLPATVWSADGTRVALVEGLSVALVDAATWTKTIVGAHVTPPTELVFNPEGTLLASSASDGIRLWDVVARRADGAAAAQWAGSGMAAFTPDGKHLVIDDETIWDVKTRTLTLDVTLCDKRGGVFSRDDARFVCVAEELHVFDLAAKKELPPMVHTAHGEIAISPHAAFAAVSTGPQSADLYDVASQRRLGPLARDPRCLRGDRWSSAIFTPDDTKIAVGVDRKHVCVWDARSRALTAIYDVDGPAHARADDSFAIPITFAASGKVLITGDSSRAFHPPNAMTAVLSGRLLVCSHFYEVSELADGTMLMKNASDGYPAAMRDGFVRVTPEGRVRLVSKLDVARVSQRDVSRVGKVLVRESEGAPVGATAWRVFDVARDAFVATLEPCPGALGGTFSPDGRRLAASGAFCVWDTATGKLLTPVLPVPPPPPASLPATLHGEHAIVFTARGLVSAERGTVTLWDQATGRPTRLYQTPPSTGTVFLADGSARALAGYPVRVTDPATGATRTFAALRETPRAFSTDGKRFLIQPKLDRLEAYDAETGALVASYANPMMNYMGGVDVSLQPGGDLVALTESGDVALLAPGGAPAHKPACASAKATANAFNLDGHLLAIGCDDGTVNLWDVTSNRITDSIHAADRRAVVRLAFSSGALAFATEAGALGVYELASRRLSLYLSSAGKIAKVAPSPDGSCVAVSPADPSEYPLELYCRRDPSRALRIGMHASSADGAASAAMAHAADGRIELLEDNPLAMAAMACTIGERELPRAICDERFIEPGLWRSVVGASP